MTDREFIKPDDVLALAEKIRRYRELTGLIAEAATLAEELTQAGVAILEPAPKPSLPLVAVEDEWVPSIHWYDKTIKVWNGELEIRAFPPDNMHAKGKWCGFAKYLRGEETIFCVDGPIHRYKGETREEVELQLLRAWEAEVVQRGMRCRARVATENRYCMNAPSDASGFCGIHSKG